MSGKALRDHNMLPISENKNESSSKGSFNKPHVEHTTNENVEGKLQKNNNTASSAVETSINGNEILTAAVVEVGIPEVEYIDSEDLIDVEDLDTSLKTLVSGLESKEWVSVCEALNNVRRISIFHKEAMLDVLDNVISLVVKSLKNPRSAVCKTAVMTSADIFSAYKDKIIDSLDPLLVQLLLKSSQDKRFVCEAAEKALIAMTSWISPVLLLPKLQPNLKHKNPRIRAKASMCFSRSVPRLGIEGIIEYGIEKLIQVAATQLSDQLPESREAARALLLELQSVYDKSQPPPPPPVSNDDPETPGSSSTGSSWENFCQSKLSPLSAQAVLRVTTTTTNIPREGGGIVLAS